MTPRSWMRNLFARPVTSPVRAGPRRSRPALEALEDRLVPATVTSGITSGLDIAAGAGDLRAGQAVQFTVNFSAAITVNTSNGFPTLAINDGATAAYSGTSGTTALTFAYTVAAGEDTSDLTVSGLDLNGAAISDAGTGDSADVSGAATNPDGILRIDTVAPATVSITRIGAEDQNDGSLLQYAVTFSEAVVGVTTGSFSLATTGVAGASITGVTPGVDAAHYTVTVASGSVDSGSGVGTVGLNVTGATVKDLAGNGLGGLKSIVAPKCDLVGGIVLGGTATRATSITLHDVGDGATITVGSKLAALTAARFGAGSLVAPSLGKLRIQGDFEADVTLSGQGVPADKLTLTQAKIGGTVRGALLNVGGNVGSFTAGAFVDSRLLMGFTPADSDDPLNDGTWLADLSLTIFQVTGIAGSADPAFVNSVVAAFQVGSVSLKSVQTGNGGKKFGILARVRPGSVTVASPAFTFDRTQPTPQGIGDFVVLDDQRMH